MVTINNDLVILDFLDDNSHRTMIRISLKDITNLHIKVTKHGAIDSLNHSFVDLAIGIGRIKSNSKLITFFMTV
jgi:hypothetical protein